MRALLLGLATVVTLSIALPAAAQDHHRAAVEGAMIQMFDTEPVTIINFLGQEGDPGHWFMVREITGAIVTDDCHLQLETPTYAAASSNVTPASHYRFGWAAVSDIQQEGNIVTWQAEHMAEGEVGGMVFESEDLAEMFSAVMEFMVEDCSGW